MNCNSSGRGSAVVTSPETIHHNNSVALWDKPWPPEIDRLDQYLNLSYLPPKIIDGIILGDKLKEDVKYFKDYKWGYMVMFKINAALADAYYVENYASANKTMFLCTPSFPTNTYLLKGSGIRRSRRLANCGKYRMGMFEGQCDKWRDWGYIWKTFGGLPLLAAMVAVTVITLTGLLGEFLV